MRSLSLFAFSLLSTIAAAQQAEVTQLTQAPTQLGDTGSISGDRIVISASWSEGLIFERNGGVWTQTGTFHQPTGDPFGLAWSRAAADGDTILAGNAGAGNFYLGTAKVYEASTNFGIGTTLFMSTAQSPDSMGSGLAICGDTLAVGGNMSVWDSGICGPGKCFIFERQGNAWVEQATFLPHGFNQDMVGYAVAMETDGATVVIGSSLDDEFVMGGGAVYVYERVGGIWQETAKLQPAAAQPDLNFGRSVSVDGDHIAVSTAAESVILFERGPAGWQQVATVVPSDGVALDSFGQSIALSGSRLAVGAPQHQDAVGFPVGAIYVFENATAGWVETLKVVDPSSSGRFGSFVDMDGTTILSLGPHWGAVSHVIEIGSLQFVANYCTSAPNSTGAAAVMSAEGSDNISNNNFTLHADNVPPGQPGIFLFGQNDNNAIQWNGTLCVAPQFYRLPFAIADATGRLTTVVDFTTPPADVVTGGTTWRFQAIFRDSIGTGVDMSDGLQVVMFP